MLKSAKLTVAIATAFALGSAPAHAAVDVVTSSQDLASIVTAVGGGLVRVEYMAGSNQDPHNVDPRPSQVARLARARLVVRTGLDLDTWFDALIRASGNPALFPGAKGYVDASRGVRLLEVPAGKLDPSQGDLHVYGNPHYFTGPTSLRVVARNIAEGLKRVDPRNGAAYDSGLAAFLARLEQSIERWRSRMAPFRGRRVVTYHKTYVYLLNDLGLVEAGTVEPRPGVEPTPGHIAGLAQRMKAEGVAAILTENNRSRRFLDLLARQSGVRVIVLPAGVGAEKGTDDYFNYMDAIVDRLVAGLR